ncbi:MAG: oligosaccharide flippase family protein [Clostridia bacterium]|nr:oligosaccharide flippase family protein [Clostridia bacterium]
MKRTTATLKNSLWSFLQQFILCILSFASRKAMLWAIGIEGVGLNGLFSNVLTFLTLAELGMGTAIVYNLFDPLARRAKDEICELMSFYRKAYHIIALAIAVFGALLIPLFPFIIKGVSYEWSYIILVYVLFLFQTVSSYFFTYKRSLLAADQRQFTVAAVDIVFKILTVLLGIVALVFTRNFVIYLSVLIVMGNANNIYVARKVDKAYPYIKDTARRLPEYKRDSIFKNVRDIFLSRVSWTITTSTDMVLISSMVGTKDVGLYSNYTIVINTLTGLVEQLLGAMSGSIGNLLVTEKADYVEQVLRRLNFLMYFISAFACSSLISLLNPLIALWLGDFTLPMSIVFMCVFNFFLWTYRAPLWRMVGFSGLFDDDKNISVFGAVVNIVVSLILGWKLGMFGILIGTAVSLTLQFVLKCDLFYSDFLKIPFSRSMKRFSLYSALVLLNMSITYFLCSQVSLSNPYAAFGVMMLICAAVPNAVNCALFWRTDEFSYFKDLLINMLRKTST